MGSPPPTVIAHRPGDAAVAEVGLPGGGGELPHQLHYPGHLLGFDQSPHVHFHPETELYERTERRHTSSRSLFPVDIDSQALATYQAGKHRVIENSTGWRDAVWVPSIAPPPEEWAEMGKLARAAGDAVQWEVQVKEFLPKWGGLIGATSGMMGRVMEKFTKANV